MLKQVSKSIDGTLLFEIECVDCRKYNYVSKEFYFYTKLDYMMPLVKPINNKLPSEMSIIFLSMERAGISWIIRELSDYHEVMFGNPIIFTKDNAEISTQIATKNRFPLPSGWNNCYGIDPQLLLDRVDPDGNKYDRIVVVHRNLKTFQNVYRIKMAREGLANDFIEKIINKTPKEYNLVYKEIEDPRLIHVDLWDLNQYTKAMFNMLMDFLNFPKYMRPPVLRVKTLQFEALMEAYSSVWDKDFKLKGMLGRVEGLFQLTNDGILEYLAKSVMNENTDEIMLKNILIIGPGLNKGVHFSENMYRIFKERGYNVELLDLIKLGWQTKEAEKYKKRHELYPISKALEHTSMEPDLILFDEPAYFFFNDVKTPVFYYHREYKRAPTIYHPDRAYFWNHDVVNSFKGIRGYPYWSAHVKEMKVIGSGFDPDKFQVKEKNIRGVSCLAGRETMKACIDMNEAKAKANLNHSLQEIVEYINLGLQWFEDENGGFTDERFRELLPTCESLWMCFPLGQYISRRIFEAMYCKAVCIFIVENEEHRAVLKSMGFIANEHYIEIEHIKDMVEIHKNWNYNDHKEMVEKAYKVVIENHTLSCKADFLIEEYKDFILKNKKVII